MDESPRRSTRQTDDQVVELDEAYVLVLGSELDQASW